MKTYDAKDPFWYNLEGRGRNPVYHFECESCGMIHRQIVRNGQYARAMAVGMAIMRKHYYKGGPYTEALREAMKDAPTYGDIPPF